MDLIARNETWKAGAVGAAACALTLAFGTGMQVITGNAGMLSALLLATTIAAWFAGKWVGIATTAAGVVAAAYLLPPTYSLRIAQPEDSGALYSFALGGIIISLL